MRRENTVRHFLTFRRPPLVLVLCGLLWALPASSQDPSRLDQVLETIVANERELADRLEQYQPLVETYLQTVRPDTTLGAVPIKDTWSFLRSRASRPRARTLASRRRKRNTRSR
jgi:hypothetical protein